MKTILGLITATLLTSTGLALAGDSQAVCPVSGEKIGEMGKPYVFTYQGREIQLCCKHCKEQFDADPAKYLKNLPAQK